MVLNVSFRPFYQDGNLKCFLMIAALCDHPGMSYACLYAFPLENIEFMLCILVVKQIPIRL